MNADQAMRAHSATLPAPKFNNPAFSHRRSSRSSRPLHCTPPTTPRSLAVIPASVSSIVNAVT